MGMFDWIWGGGSNAQDVEDMGRVVSAPGASQPPIPTRKPTNTGASNGYGGFTDALQGVGILGAAKSLLNDYYEYDIIKENKYVSPSGVYGYGGNTPTAYSGAPVANNGMNLGLVIGAAILGATALIAVILD
jgi:hypothetical protein